MELSTEGENLSLKNFDCHIKAIGYESVNYMRRSSSGDNDNQYSNQFSLARHGRNIAAVRTLSSSSEEAERTTRNTSITSKLLFISY